MEKKNDYLTSDDPIYDVLITNPPFCLKHEFLAKVLESRKPAILLLPLQILTAKKSYDLLKSCSLDMMIFNPSPKFLHAGGERQVGDCGWFFINMVGEVGGKFTTERLSEEI
jgi:hypothetical protein